ncbi:MAG: hypothetical protein HY920_04115 [Elusimicrobia bacterium]|nr:hypothetical protein [Elusimicrobiota bacterium]
MINSLRLDKGQIEVMDSTMVDILRRKTPAERIAIGFGLWISARNMLASHLRHTHPQWSEEELQREIIKRMSHGTI